MAQYKIRLFLLVISTERERVGNIASSATSDTYESIDTVHKHTEAQLHLPKSIMQMRFYFPDLLDHSVRKFIFNFEHGHGAATFLLLFLQAIQNEYRTPSIAIIPYRLVVGLMLLFLSYCTLCTINSISIFSARSKVKCCSTTTLCESECVLWWWHIQSDWTKIWLHAHVCMFLFHFHLNVFYYQSSVHSHRHHLFGTVSVMPHRSLKCQKVLPPPPPKKK